MTAIINACKAISLGLSLIVLILILPACKKSTHKPDANGQGNIPTNEWVTENMRIYYYWNRDIPSDKLLDFQLTPPDFFETLRNKNDRFSWIQNADELKDNLSGISTTTGINFQLGLYGDESNPSVFGYIRYVIPGSPADIGGIKRGDLFTKVNDKSMNKDNYNEVLEPYYKGQGYKLTLAKLENYTITETSDIELNAVKVDEPSVHFHTVLTTNSGRKVGYLFYNQFINDKIQEVFNAFQDFRDQGIQDLILDIRYNLGGGIAASGILSALIMQNYDMELVYVNYNYNQDLNQQFSQEEREKKFKDLYPAFVDEAGLNAFDSKVKAANLNLSKIYILATDNSASASELVINDLEPYMEVVHIGDTTYGKNEGSITIEDDDDAPPKIEWAIQPIILKLANSEGFGDYPNGLVPDFVVEESLPLQPLGSKNDPLIAKALGLIDPSMAIQTRIIPPKAMEMLTKLRASKIDQFNKKVIPVQVDGTFDLNLLKNK